MEDTESVDQSVESGDTSVSEESTSQVEASDAEEQDSTPEKQPEEKPTPFHEHPRFKELIEQNRAFKEESTLRAQAIENMQRELHNLRQQSLPKKEEPKDEFLADLEKVNPAYAKSFQSVMERAAKAEDVERRLQAYETQQFQEKALNKFTSLLSENKVTDPMDQRIYKAAIREAVIDMEQSGKRPGIKDLDNLFSTFHKEYSKSMEDRNRKLTASYVQDKTKDRAPKSTTGLPAAPGGKKLAAGDISGQAKWLANQIREMKKEH